jgi:phage recombination protein Bet
MAEALIERPTPAPPHVTAEQFELIARTIAAGATPDELKLFLYDNARQGVHPLDRLLHFTKRNGKYTPIVSIDFMRTRAAETGEYVGNDDATFTASPSATIPAAATVTVYRLVQGQRCAFSASARWPEYYPGDGAPGFMWRKMPYLMLGKCAEALALRKGFPRQLAGVYIAEELDQAHDDPGGDTDGSLGGDTTRQRVRDARRHAPPAPVEAPAPVERAPVEHEPAPADPPSTGAPGPEAVVITKVDPPWNGQEGPAKAWLYHDRQPFPAEGLPIYSVSLKALAEEFAASKTPVVLDIRVAASGKKYVKAIARVADTPPF